MPQYTPRERGGRLALAIAAAAVAWTAVSDTMGQVESSRDVKSAYRLAPHDGRITSLYALVMASSAKTSADRRKSEALALLSLRKEPVALAGIITLGMNARAEGQTARERRLLAYAQKLTRRDLSVQLWAIEDAVSRGDIDGALHQYDIALRTNDKAAVLLFPVLASSIAQPSIRIALGRTLRSRPAWSERFVNYLADQGPDSLATALLFEELQSAGMPVTDAARALIINILIEQGKPEQAWKTYAAARRDFDRRRSRDPRFRSHIDPPSRFDWVPADAPGAIASIQDGAFDFVVPSSVGGPLLKQEQFLPPGTYRLVGHGNGIAEAGNAQAYWALTCRDGRDLGRVPVTGSRSAHGGFAGTFSVPAWCAVQTLAFIAQPSNGGGETSGQVDFVQLEPAP